MRNFQQLIEKIKEEINLSGHLGVNYQSISVKFEINFKISFHIAKNYLIPCGYIFSEEIGNTLPSLDQIQTFENINCVAPEYAFFDTYGMETSSIREDDNSTMLNILEQIISSREQGTLVSDIPVKSPFRFLDKLNLLGLITKTSIFKNRSDNSPNNLITIYHFKKFTIFYNFVPFSGEEIIDDIVKLFHKFLTVNSLNYISFRDLTDIFKIKLLAFQTNISYLQKFKQNKLRTYQRYVGTLKGNGNIGRVPWVWCIGMDNESENNENVISNLKFQGISNIQCLDVFVNKTLELSSLDIRILLSASTKKAYKISCTLINSLGYPSKKVQDNKAIVQKVLPKDLPSKIIYVHNLTSIQDRITDRFLINSDTTSEPALHISTFQSPSSKKRSIDNLLEEDNFEILSKKKKLLSNEQHTRVNLVNTFLEQSPFGFGIFRDLRLFIKYHYRLLNKTQIDSKTINRTINKLIEDNEIILKEINLPQSAVNNYRIADSSLLIMKSNNWDELTFEENLKLFFESYKPLKSQYFPALPHEDKIEAPYITQEKEENIEECEEYSEDESDEFDEKDENEEEIEEDSVSAIVDSNEINLVSTNIMSNKINNQSNKPRKNKLFDFPQIKDIYGFHHYYEKITPKAKIIEYPNWNREEEIKVFDYFVNNIFYRKSRFGFPYILQGSKKPKNPGKRIYFATSPSLSLIKFDILDINLQHLRNNYVSNPLGGITGINIDYAKRKLQQMIKSFKNLREFFLGSFWSFQNNLSENVLDFLRYAFQQFPYFSSQSIFPENKYLVIYLTILKFASFANPMSFTIDDIVKIVAAYHSSSVDSNPLIPDLSAQKDYFISVIQVLRELFFHDCIRRRLLIQKQNDLSEIQIIDQSHHHFIFDHLFLNHFIDQYRTYFFINLFWYSEYQTISNNRRIARVKNGDDIIDDAMPFFLLTHQICLDNILFLSQNIHIKTIISIKHSDDNAKDNNVSIESSKEFNNSSNETNKVIFTVSNPDNMLESNSYSTKLSQVETSFSFESSHITRFTKISPIDISNAIRQSYNNFVLLPWWDIQCDGVQLDLFKQYTSVIFAFLAEYPASNINQIHNNIPILPTFVIQSLLDTLILLGFIRKFTSIPSYKISNPFTSNLLWKSNFQNNRIDQIDRYELI